MKAEADCVAILLAGGSGKRLGFDKILTPLLGKPVIQYSLEALAEADSIKEIVVVGRSSALPALEALTSRVSARKKFKVVEGGVERQDSVWNGLQAVEGAGFVLIHDGARPLLTAEVVKKLVESAWLMGSAVAGNRSTDTLKECDDAGRVTATPDRSRMWQVQTPQVFRSEWVRSGYRKVVEEKISVTDDAAAVELAGFPVHLIETGLPNLKITRPYDWQAVEEILRRQELFSIRNVLHQIANDLSPLVGYLPLLKKHRLNEERFLELTGRIEEGTQQLQAHLAQNQEAARRLYPDHCSNEKPPTM
jgi:2-C-methyl-D-erythritol 4-phosphate cytidylyltransferase